MRFPWTSRERRAGNYTTQVIDAIEGQVSGANVGKKLAAIAIARGLYSRAFASASVTPDTPQSRALTPTILGLIGRSLVFPGEALLQIVVNGNVSLRPIASANISGGPDPETWTYECEIDGPSESRSTILEASAVVHIRPVVDAAQPWKGVGPLSDSDVTVKAAMLLEQAVQYEAGASVGFILPTPPGKKTTLQNDLRALRGRLSLVDSTSGGWDSGKDAAPMKDFQPERLGPVFSESELPVRDSLSLSILAACGVPVSVLGRSDGTLARESFRQFIGLTIQPLAKMVVEELAAKLDLDGLSLDFTSLRASDVTGRSRAFSSLVQGGYGMDEAARIAGLLDA